MDEGNQMGMEDACKAFFAAGAKKDWAAAAQAYRDLCMLSDEEYAEEEPEEKSKGGKKPLSLILIGGPEKK